MSDWRVPLNMWHSGKNSSQITKVAGIKSQERNMLETGDLPPNMQMGCGGHGMFGSLFQTENCPKRRIKPIISGYTWPMPHRSSVKQ